MGVISSSWMEIVCQRPGSIIGCWSFSGAGRVWLAHFDRTPKRMPMSAECRERLKKQFTPEIQALEKLIDRDLSHWHGVCPSKAGEKE